MSTLINTLTRITTLGSTGQTREQALQIGAAPVEELGIGRFLSI